MRSLCITNRIEGQTPLLSGASETHRLRRRYKRLGRPQGPAVHNESQLREWIHQINMYRVRKNRSNHNIGSEKQQKRQTVSAEDPAEQHKDRPVNKVNGIRGLRQLLDYIALAEESLP